MKTVVNCYAAHALIRKWGLFCRSTDTWQYCSLKRNLPKFSDLANETMGRNRRKRESSQNQEVAHESTAFDWTHVGAEGMIGPDVINFE